jgi:hypothetical protein
MFVEGRWIQAEGSQAVIEEEAGRMYPALALRNIGAGIAVVHGWHVWSELVRSEVGRVLRRAFAARSVTST